MKRNHYQKIFAENLHGKSQKIILVQTNFEEKLLPKIPEEKVFTKKFSKRNHCQKICDKVLCQRISKETCPAKSLERGISTKKKSKHFWQNLFDNFSTKNSLKRHLYQTNFSSNPYRKSIGRNISTTNSLKGDLYRTIFKRNPYRKIFQEKIYKTIFKEKN